MTSEVHHEIYMRQAIALARKAWGHTHPNPLVGAVIVEGGQVVAAGYHEKAGCDHAEVAAIKALNRAPKPDATLYVTLEPCSTTGRTAPCTEAIVQSGIKRLVVGAIDPNPAHAGRGLALLREHGIDVVEGVLAEDCTDMNLIFNHWVVHKRPLIAGKVASTLDGKTATREGHSKWITGEGARQDVHHWRRYFPAIAVGSGTVRSDNPALTSRLDETTCGVRFVFDRALRTVREPLPQIYTDEWRHKTIIITELAEAPKRYKLLEKQGVEVWNVAGREFFDAFNQKCAELNITGVYIEGGSSLLGVLIEERRIDYLFAYRAPMFFSDPEALPGLQGLVSTTLDAAPRLKNVRHATFGDDQLMRGEVVYPAR